MEHINQQPFKQDQIKYNLQNLYQKVVKKMANQCQKYLNFDGPIIGYYKLRGKAQVCRLVCEYLHISYLDLIFNPQSWEEFKTLLASNWNYQQLPFLKHKQLIITETFPICLYLIHLANRKDLLGKTIVDEAKVDMFVWQSDLMGQILCFSINQKGVQPNKRVEALYKFYNQVIRQKLNLIESQATTAFYLSYLTIVDFYIYDLVYMLRHAVGDYKMQQFPKLCNIYKQVAAIPEIIAYQNSSKCVKDMCPAQLCEKWKQKCLKSNHK